MEIVIIESGKKDFLDLLLLADEQENMIEKYLYRGTLFALYDDGLKTVCVVTDEGDGMLEIQNLYLSAVSEEGLCQPNNRSYSSALQRTLCKHLPRHR